MNCNFLCRRVTEIIGDFSRDWKKSLDSINGESNKITEEQAVVPVQTKEHPAKAAVSKVGDQAAATLSPTQPLLVIPSNEITEEVESEEVRVNEQILKYIKTLKLGSLLSIKTLMDLAGSTSTATNVTILPTIMIGDFKLDGQDRRD